MKNESNSKHSTREGYAEVTGGNVWYRIDGNGDKTPLLILHGGPGFPSYYLNPMSALSKDRPVIFFDQLGCGRSDNNTDKNLMTVDVFVEQTEQLRNDLKLNQFHLYGHSWGSMLGLEYYLKYSEHVKALILASPALSISRWIKDADALITILPNSVQSAIRTNIENGTFESPEFEDAINIYYQHFIAKKLPWDQNIGNTFTQANLEIYNYMWGPSEFTATGILKDYEGSDKLPRVKVPTLFITGEYDEARPETVEYYQSLIPHSKYAMIEDAAHLTMHDKPEENNQVIEDFLRDIE